MNRTLLLVEDNADEAEIFQIAAAEAGLLGPIRVAGSGEEALQILAQKRVEPAAILLDLKMPGIGGLETLRRLKEDALLRLLPVYVVTSSDLEEDKARAQELGCDLYLVKPTTLGGYIEMAKTIKEALTGSRRP